MTKTQWLLSGASLAILVSVLPASAETLEQAMATAYQSNPTILSERSKLRATDELVPQALANWRPTVTVSGNITRSNLNEYFGGGNGVQTGGSGPGVTPNTPGAQIYTSDTMGLQVTEALYR